MADEEKDIAKEPPYELPDLVASVAHSIREAEKNHPGVLHVIVDSMSEKAVKTMHAAAAKARGAGQEKALAFAKAVEGSLEAAKGRKAAHMSVTNFSLWQLLAKDFGVETKKPAAGNVAFVVFGEKSAAFECSHEQLANIDKKAGEIKSN